MSEITVTEFNEFVAELRPELLRAAVRLCNKNHAMAEDAVQNTLLLAYEKLEQFQIINPNTPKHKLFRGWLHRLLVNMVSYMWARKSGPPKPAQQQYAYASFVYCINMGTTNFSEYESPFDRRHNFIENHVKSVQPPGDIEYILKAIDELPIYQEIAKLAFIDGLTSPEIAVRLHLAEGTIRKRIWQVRELLREKLADYVVEAN